MTGKKTIAIIGASIGQKALYQKAREKGLRIIGFAWDRGILEENDFDEFHEISVTETDAIAGICRRIGVDGIVTNASEFLVPLASEVAEKLNLPCTPSPIIRRIQDKRCVRELTNNISGLSTPMYYEYPHATFHSFPCVVKPVTGASKKGVSFCKDQSDLSSALEYADKDQNRILVEEYIPGREFSVECLSCKGRHEVVQITDKENSGPPHFVELGHHQPSTLKSSDSDRIKDCAVRLLDEVGFENGATHIEMKLDETSGRLFLIEINCRGGGDHISDTLVGLSTNCDYIGAMIDIALGSYTAHEYENTAYTGICYLSKQNERLLRYFSSEQPSWIIHSERIDGELCESTSNYDRNGFFIYKSLTPVVI